MNTKEKIIAAGVRNLKEFGYPDVTAENIITDNLYAAFFKQMLEDHEGPGKAEAQEILNEINRL